MCGTWKHSFALTTLRHKTLWDCERPPVETKTRIYSIHGLTRKIFDVLCFSFDRTEGVEGYGYSLDVMLSEDEETSSTSASSGSDDVGEFEASGDGGSDSGSENEWWVAVASGGAAGLGLLVVGLVLFLSCRGRPVVAKKPGPDDGEEKAEMKAEEA